MALRSTKYDFRIDPFTEADEAIDISNEEKTIPAASPFYIQTEEVSRLDDPSTITIYNVTDAITMTEVSASPGSQEFQVDYPTLIGQNPSPARYGTGKIRFNSAQANKVVRVTYKGTGHLIKAFYINDIQNRVNPSGVIQPWTTDTAPDGYLLCDGASYVRTEYSDLFAVIGTVFGAADGTHFNVPDLRGRIPLGKDNMGGTSANRVTAAAADTIGGSGGAETHTLTTDEMPAHKHTIGATSGGGTGISSASSTTSVAYDTSIVGGGGAHNNLQPYITLTYIIKT